MALKIYSLNKTLKLLESKDSKSKLLESFSNFKCKYNSIELESFLKNNALEFEERSLSRTYIAYGNDVWDILGYFSISVKSIDLVDMTRSMKKTVASDDRAFSAPVFLLAHIGETETCGFEKYELLNTAISLIKSAHDIVGGRAICLDCDKNNEKLFDYYFKKGFRLMSENSKFKRMVLSL